MFLRLKYTTILHSSEQEVFDSQTLVHINRQYTHHKAYQRAPRVTADTLGAHESSSYRTKCTFMCTKVWRRIEDGHRSWQWPASSSKQATQLSCCRRLLAAKVRWTVCLSLTRLALPALCHGSEIQCQDSSLTIW